MPEQPKPAPLWSALLIFTFGALLFAPFLLMKAAWVGRKSLPVEVTVVDKDSGEPVGGAQVLVGDGHIRWEDSLIHWRAGQAPQEAATSPAGVASLNVSFTTAGLDYLWTYSGSASFGPICLEASAPGYRTRRVELVELAGTGRNVDPDLWPLRVTVPLAPKVR
ncbi:MAG: carboxypeptidase-like regulatory domain-containing protein [Pirellulales bacterium]